MYDLIKRFFDLIFSVILLILMLPLFILISFLLRFSGEGYIFYFQQRIGKNNIPFQIWKFATMLKDSVNMKGGIITVKNDPRITYFGNFLRKSKINETPQLINIFLGHMSFVGPRPVMQESLDAYPEHIKNKIYRVKPGLTGLGSIIFRDEEGLITNADKMGIDKWKFYKEKIYPYKGDIELYYQKNKNIFMDIKILIFTILVVLGVDSKNL